MKVQNFYNKNQFIIFGGDAIVTFQSYNSIIAKIDKNGALWLGNDWDYSKTTLKHLYLFIDNYFSLLGDFTKKLFGYEFNNSKNKKAYIQNLIDNEVLFIKDLN